MKNDKPKGPLYPETAIRLRKRMTEVPQVKRCKSSSSNGQKKSSQNKGSRHLTIRAAARRGTR